MTPKENENRPRIQPRAAGRLPNAYQRWHLYGAGLESVGMAGKPESLPMPTPGPTEILVRHDACGICYSDIKIINLGGEHPRLAGRDLQTDPVVMGHEVALTVVEAGENYRDRFLPGQRFIVQADIFYGGVGLAYGYALPGGMSQYGLIGAEVIEGDEGCYLLAIDDTTGYAEAALVEPWACVEAAYRWSDGAGSASEKLVFESAPTADAFEAACATLAKNTTVHLRFAAPLERLVAVDVGRIHYDGHRYVGPKSNTRGELRGGGTTWFVGAAGPMGQMHVQRALQLPHPPKRIVGTDRRDNRLDALRSRFGALARDRGVELLLFNVREGDPDFTALAPNGFDDIVVNVPSLEAIEQGFPLLAENGVLNVFAGVARGTMARLPIWEVATRNVRIVGTTGSTLADMTRTRDLLEARQLETGASLAAIGGLHAFRDGLDAVKNGRFPGKTVIFPQIEDLPLTALTDLETVRPAVYAKLKNGQLWTAEAEAELMSGRSTTEGS
ncbi:MAG: alcohol dehydrogenase catalytic domain-containing protein [Cytophagales bacterium]|nr:alcohol dehydrogenase catalytic domain-containing protein [Armatimonadota bacterium]